MKRVVKGEDFDQISDGIVRLIKRTIADKSMRASAIYRGMGRSRSWWSQTMNGKRNISLKDLFEIARLLGVKPAALLPDDEGAAPKPANVDDDFEKKVLAILDRRKK